MHHIRLILSLDETWKRCAVEKTEDICFILELRGTNVGLSIGFTFARESPRTLHAVTERNEREVNEFRYWIESSWKATKYDVQSLLDV
jgi:hypothetical protein